MKTTNAQDMDSLIVHMVVTYKSLRRLLAAVALIFLALLLAYRYWGDDTMMRYSISAYYHNQGQLFGFVPVRDLFVGAFSSIALMLYAYKGYTWHESQLLNVAGIALLVVATCPMEWTDAPEVAKDLVQLMDQNRNRAELIANAQIPDPAKDRAQKLQSTISKSEHEAQALVTDVGNAGTQDGLPQTVTGWAHYAGAFVFFLGIAWVCWFHADDTLKLIDDPTREARYQYLYRVTSILMALVPVLATVLYLCGLRSTVFWVEFAGVGVFILYWSIKSHELSDVQLPPSGVATPSIKGV